MSVFAYFDSYSKLPLERIREKLLNPRGNSVYDRIIRTDSFDAAAEKLANGVDLESKRGFIYEFPDDSFTDDEIAFANAAHDIRGQVINVGDIVVHNSLAFLQVIGFTKYFLKVKELNPIYPNYGTMKKADPHYVTKIPPEIILTMAVRA